MNVINKENFYELIGSAIKSKRKELRYTQSELAQKTGMSRTSIGNIESGRQYPPVHLLWEIGQALECNPIEFYPSSSKDFYRKTSSSEIAREVKKVSRDKNINKDSIKKITSFINEF